MNLARTSPDKDLLAWIRTRKGTDSLKVLPLGLVRDSTGVNKIDIGCFSFCFLETFL